MKRILKLLYLCSLLLLTNCDVDENPLPAPDKLSQLDKLFINGFRMELVQVYLMDCRRHSIPALNTPVVPLFDGGQHVINTPHFRGLCGERWLYSLYDLRMNEVWTIHPMIIVTGSQYTEHGWGSNRVVVRLTTRTPHTFITTDNPTHKRDFLTRVVIGNIRNYRCRDNHLMEIYHYSGVCEEFIRTNLRLTVLSDNVFKQFDGEYLYLSTNGITLMNYNISRPLTSNQVRIQIELGNYELYVRGGFTYFRIGQNLYRPSFGDNFIFAGSTNQVGMISGIVSFHFRLKFRIL